MKISQSQNHKIAVPTAADELKEGKKTEKAARVGGVCVNSLTGGRGYERPVLQKTTCFVEPWAEFPAKERKRDAKRRSCNNLSGGRPAEGSRPGPAALRSQRAQQQKGG